MTFLRAVRIDNVPVVPAGLTATADGRGASATIEVRWVGNPEPDLAGYRLQECVKAKASKPCADADWEVIDEPAAGETAVAVEAGRAGAFRYRLAAVRPGVGEGALRVSPFSAPTAVEVAPAPPSTVPEKDDGEQRPEQERVVTPVQREGEPPAQVAPRQVTRSGPSVSRRSSPPPEPEPDPGFQEHLPYDREGGGTASGQPLGEVDGGGDLRTTLIPVAGGMLMLVFAGHMWYVNRRAQSHGAEEATLAVVEPAPFDDAVPPGDPAPDDAGGPRELVGAGVGRPSGPGTPSEGRRADRAEPTRRYDAWR